MEWGFMGGFTAIAIVGIWIGAHFVQRVPPLILRRAFATLLLVMGLWMLYQNRSVVGLGCTDAAAVAPPPPATPL